MGWVLQESLRAGPLTQAFLAHVLDLGEVGPVSRNPAEMSEKGLHSQSFPPWGFMHTFMAFLRWPLALSRGLAKPEGEVWQHLHSHT